MQNAITTAARDQFKLQLLPTIVEASSSWSFFPVASFREESVKLKNQWIYLAVIA